MARNRRAVLTGLGGLVAGGFVGGATRTSGRARTAASQNETTTDITCPTTTTTETTTETTQSDTLSFKRSGSEVLEDVSLNSGLTIVEGTHEGASNFIVKFVPSEGRNTIVINAIGTYDGATATLAQQGTYMVDVAADGQWSLTIRQPRPSAGDVLP